MPGVVPERAEVQREHLHGVEHVGGETLVQAVRRGENILRADAGGGRREGRREGSGQVR
jgi:hypothetical protein